MPRWLVQHWNGTAVCTHVLLRCRLGDKKKHISRPEMTSYQTLLATANRLRLQGEPTPVGCEKMLVFAAEGIPAFVVSWS